MDKDRRDFLTLGLAYAGMAALPGIADLASPAVTVDRTLHPVTRSLLERITRTPDVVDRSRVERVIHERSETKDFARPVIKWMPDAQAAFDRLRRYELNELLRMGSANFWQEARCSTADEDVTPEHWVSVHRLAAEGLRVEDHDRALMAPKLAARREASTATASPEEVFAVRAVGAQIGWIETSIPAVAALALCRVEALMSRAYPQTSTPVHHQLMIIEAYEHGLLATWETPGELICVPKPLLG